MNQLTTEKRAQIIRCLCEGMSIRATVRTTGAAKNTVVKLLADIGKACSIYQDNNIRNLNSRIVQCDEIWSFIGCKDRHATPEKKALGQGNAWTWTALDSDSKLIITWHLGGRSDDDCEDFMLDLADRLAKRIQLSTDGLGTYNNAVKLAFGKDIDYDQVIKVYGQDENEQKRYSPAICTECYTKQIVGEPIESLISTSHIERSNLTIRMQNRRFTRLTNAFSKSIENHGHSLALTFMFYNYCRPHLAHKKKEDKTQRTPAMVAGLTKHVWTIEEMIETVFSN